MNYGNVYEVQFEQPIAGLGTNMQHISPVKVVGFNISDAITKTQQMYGVAQIASAKLIVQGVNF